MDNEEHTLLRRLPQVGELLAGEPYQGLMNAYPRERVSRTVRCGLQRIREEIHSAAHTADSLHTRLLALPADVSAALKNAASPHLRRVINATGVILQTNLGRAPLGQSVLQRVCEVASGYCNLELNLSAGRRSYRDVHVEQLILEVLATRGGQHTTPLVDRAAAVVNNCAAATLLALNTLAEGGEVVVSRGELVEIGGGFRVPEILRKSGAVLREVGTTNRTRIGDYAAALTPATRLILRVHRSNFHIEGFTEQPTLQELVALGQRSSVPVFEDQGTGCTFDLASVGVANESSLLQSVRSGLSLVACSGDKLLGGPQCGILIGAHTHIECIRENPLFRALRVDKLTYAALEGTLQAYLQEEYDALPALAMMRLSAESIRRRCEALASSLRGSALSAAVLSVQSVIGGGTTPGATLPSYAVALRHAKQTEQQLADRLRQMEPAVITRTADRRVWMDLRTVFPREDALLQSLLLRSTEPTGKPAPEAAP